ncbi:hypothetical protein CN481_00240 [Bacillus sp. AFS006103]|nr:hypothetical protein CN481_00240 [Bacillus sp. AFS006103]
MKEPLFEEGFELFECPRCNASIVKYRFDIEPTGSVVHWGECDFTMCRTHHELHYPGQIPKDPISLLVVKNLSREELLREIFKRDPMIKKASEKLDKLREDPEFIQAVLKREIDKDKLNS